MDIKRSREIICLLADGVDPDTGVEVPATSPLQRPDVVRALHRAIEAIDRDIWREHRRKGLPANTGKMWEPVEDRLLTERFDRGDGIDQIAALHARTEVAIRERLVKLGRLPPTH